MWDEGEKDQQMVGMTSQSFYKGSVRYFPAHLAEVSDEPWFTLSPGLDIIAFNHGHRDNLSFSFCVDVHEGMEKKVSIMRIASPTHRNCIK